ncbi:MAG: hypothetical protein HW374_1884, partial [Bacteroidetes bacterium]|nr:hypothetical protein [Bacteroidota bacterium]
VVENGQLFDGSLQPLSFVRDELRRCRHLVRFAVVVEERSKM